MMTIPQKSTSKPFWRVFTIVSALILMGFMLSLVDWDSFRGLLLTMPMWSLLAGLFIYTALNFFRALRFRSLMNRDGLPLMTIFWIALYHNFLVRLLPFKLGEVIYPYEMRQRLDVPTREGISSLFASRLLELLVIILIFGMTLLVSGDILPNQGVLAGVLVGFTVAGAVGGFYFSGLLLRVGCRVVRRVTQIPMIIALVVRFEHLADELDSLRHPKTFLEALFWSCFTYGSSFATNAVLLVGAGVQVTAIQLIVLVSLGMFATAFPLNISGFGMVELSWTFGLTTFAGYAVGTATSIGLLLNGYQLVCAAITGLIAYAILKWQEGYFEPQRHKEE